MTRLDLLAVGVVAAHVAVWVDVAYVAGMRRGWW